MEDLGAGHDAAVSAEDVEPQVGEEAKVSETLAKSLSPAVEPGTGSASPSLGMKSIKSFGSLFRGLPKSPSSDR